MTTHEEKAREILAQRHALQPGWLPSRYYRNGVVEALERDIAAALRQAERDALERAATALQDKLDAMPNNRIHDDAGRFDPHSSYQKNHFGPGMNMAIKSIRDLAKED